MYRLTCSLVFPWPTVKPAAVIAEASATTRLVPAENGAMICELLTEDTAVGESAAATSSVESP
jgi:hypothetical protein